MVTPTIQALRNARGPRAAGIVDDLRKRYSLVDLRCVDPTGNFSYVETGRREKLREVHGKCLCLLPL